MKTKIAVAMLCIAAAVAAMKGKGTNVPEPVVHEDSWYIVHAEELSIVPRELQTFGMARNAVLTNCTMAEYVLDPDLRASIEKDPAVRKAMQNCPRPQKERRIGKVERVVREYILRGNQGG